MKDKLSTLTVGDKDKFDQEFLNMLLDKGYNLEDLLSLNSEESAEKFVDLAMQIDYLTPKSERNNLDYFRNISGLLLLLAKKEGFYNNVKEEVKNLDYDVIPSRAKLLLCSQ